MTSEFEPFKNDLKKSEFSVWEYRNEDDDVPSEISPEEAFLNQCETLKQEAIAKGYAEGMQQAQAEINEKKAEFSRWFDLLQKPAQLVDEKLSQEMIQTVIWLCQYCIGIELSVNPEKLHALFTAIKEELPSLKGNKVFAMHPTDAEWIKAEFNEKEIPGLHDILVADPSLSRGDFYLKGENSELDGRLHSRFTTIFAKYINKETFTPPTQTQD